MSDASQVLGVTQIAITVSDPPTALKFYRDAIGLP